MKGKLLFEETQTYKGGFIWYATLLFCIAMSGLFVYGLIVQIGLGQTWGSKPMSDSGLIFTSLFTFAISGGILALIHFHKLVLTIDEGTIAYLFYPYVSRTRVLHRDEIKTVSVRKYRPIPEYGGWGFRIGWKGKAYTLWGKYGLQLEFTNGKKLLIGTRKATELEVAVREFLERGELNHNG